MCGYPLCIQLGSTVVEDDTDLLLTPQVHRCSEGHVVARRHRGSGAGFPGDRRKGRPRLRERGGRDLGSGHDGVRGPALTLCPPFGEY